MRASDAQKTQFLDFHQNKAGAPGEGPRGPGWSDGALKSSADSPRAGESIARIRCAENAIFGFSPKRGWGPGRGPQGTWVVRWGPKKFCRLPASWRVDCAHQMRGKRNFWIFTKTRLGPRERAPGDLGGPIGPKKVLQTPSELASRIRALVAQKNAIFAFSPKRGRGPGRGPQGSMGGPIGPKKVLQTPSELASRMRASDAQKTQFLHFHQNEAGDPGEAPRGPGWSDRAQKSSADSHASWRVECAHQMRRKRNFCIFTKTRPGTRERPPGDLGGPIGPKKVLQTPTRPGESNARIRCAENAIFAFSPKTRPGPRERAPGDLGGPIGPKKVLQTPSELASRMRASDAQKTQFLHFHQNEAGAPGEGPRGPGWSDRAQKSSADSQRAGESNARIRCAENAIFAFSPKRGRGPGRGPQGTWVVRSGPKKFCRLPATWRVECAHQMRRKRNFCIFIKTRPGPRERPPRGPGWSDRAQKSSADSQRPGESIARIRCAENAIFAFSPKRGRGPGRGPQGSWVVRSGPKKFCRLPASWRVECAHQMRRKRNFCIFTKNEAGDPGEAPRGPGWSDRAQKSSADSHATWRVECAHQMRRKRNFCIFTKTRPGPRERAPGDLGGPIGPKKVLQTPSELASRMRASDAQKTQFLHFHQNEAGAPGEGPRGPGWSDRAQKSSADSQRAGESNARIRCAENAIFAFSPKRGRGPGRGPQGTWVVRSGPKKFCRLPATWRVECAHQMRRKRNFCIFIKTRPGPRERPPGDLGGPIGTQKSSADSQRPGESNARIRCAENAIFAFSPKRGRGPGRGPQGTWVVRSGPKKFCRLPASWRVECAHQMRRKRNFCIFTKTRPGPRERAPGDLGGPIGPKKVLQTPSELASRMRASDAQKTQFLHFHQNEAGAPGEGPRGPGWSDRAQKSSADSQRAGESNARIRCAENAIFAFSPKRGRGPGRGPQGTWVVRSGPKKFCRLPATWRVECAHQMRRKRNFWIFTKTRLGPRERAPGDLGGPMGPKKVLQTPRELASRLRASDARKTQFLDFHQNEAGAPGEGPRGPGWSDGAQKSSADSPRAGESIARIRCAENAIFGFSPKRGWGPGRGPQGTWVVRWGPKKFCRLPASWRVDCAHQMRRKRNFWIFTKTRLGPRERAPGDLGGPMGP